MSDIYETLTKGLYKIELKSPSYEISPEQITSGSILASLNQVMNAMAAGKTRFDNSEIGYILGLDAGVAKFYIGSTTKYINWDGENLSIVGGVDISQLNIPDSETANSFHVNSSGDTWWGCNVENFNTDNDNAIAYVLKTGEARFTNVNITGGPNVVFISDTIDTSTKKILSDFTFGSTDYAGSLKTGDITWNTTTGAITGGSGILINKGGIIGASSGVATFTIDGATGSATFAGTLGAAAINTAGYVRGGQTDYNTGTGFFLGYSGAAYKFSIGDPSGQNLTWDGTNLNINGPGITKVRIYDADDTWTKPSGIVMIDVICIGAGGGGGGGQRTSPGGGQSGGGGGGGGGALARGTIKAADLGATVAVTVGVGGTGGVGVSTNIAGGNGTDGGMSYFGTHLKAGGGGGAGGGGTGPSGNGWQGSSGGAGGGIVTSAVYTTRGTPGIAASNGIACQAVDMGGNTEYGGAGGDFMVNLSAVAGGSSIFAGPGGGCGAYSNYGGPTTGRDGGGNMRYTNGGGAAGGTDGNPGTAGSGSNPYCGTGGGGGGGGGQVGGAGGTGAGGGGGSGANDPQSSGAGGAGGNGRVIIIEYY